MRLGLRRRTVPTRTLVWCVGVRADPFVEGLDLPTQNGRLVVDEYLAVPGHPEILACGDAAAVPDLTRPGKTTAMTAQHAERQGRLAGHNVAAALGNGQRKAYRHHDLGFLVDLAGVKAAKVVTRGYHLTSMPGNRIRTSLDWAADAVLRRQGVQLGLVRAPTGYLLTGAAATPVGAGGRMSGQRQYGYAAA
jgi:NADH dehydrogenase